MVTRGVASMTLKQHPKKPYLLVVVALIVSADSFTFKDRNHLKNAGIRV